MVPHFNWHAPMCRIVFSSCDTEPTGSCFPFFPFERLFPILSLPEFVFDLFLLLDSLLQFFVGFFLFVSEFFEL